MFEQIKSFDFSRWRSARAFAKQRADFFSDAALVLGTVKLPAILALRIKANDGTPLGDAYYDISSEYRSGKKLSEAFGPYLDDGERLAMSGWDSADSDEVLAKGFSMIGQIASAGKQIRAAMSKVLTMSMGSLGLALFLLWTMKSQVYPSLEKYFPVHQWALPARATYYIVNAMFANLWVFALCVVTIVGMYIWSLPNWTSPLRRRLDQSIFYSWYRGYRSLQVLLALALHLQAKRGVGNSLRLIMEQASPWENWYLQEMWLRNERGEEGGTVFDVGFFDRSIKDRILLLSTAGSAEIAMESIAFTTQKELLEQFRERILLVGETVKRGSLLAGAVPMMLFFITLGNFIVFAVSTGFKH